MAVFALHAEGAAFVPVFDFAVLAEAFDFVTFVREGEEGGGEEEEGGEGIHCR